MHFFSLSKFSFFIGRFSILSKCLSDLNLLQNALKTNFKKIKHYEIKTLVTNQFLDKYRKS